MSWEAPAGRLDPAPVSVVVFGSFARGEADSESDIDVLVVRARSVHEDDDTWCRDLDEWRLQAARLAGNRVDVLEVGEQDVGRSVGGRQPLWADIERDGVVVFGAALAAV